MARWWRRKQPYRHAYRCGECGWYPPGRSGYVRGVHDPKFVGHAFYCPARLYSSITTADGIADQWHAISAWARASEAVDLPGWDDTWRHTSYALVKRADMLGVPSRSLTTPPNW